MKELKIIEKENKTIVIHFGNIAKAEFYDVVATDKYKLRKTISFRTIKSKPKTKYSTIQKSDGSLFAVNQRIDELGYSIRTSLKDILSYLDGTYEGELIENKGKVKFLKEE